MWDKRKKKLRILKTTNNQTSRHNGELGLTWPRNVGNAQPRPNLYPGNYSLDLSRQQSNTGHLIAPRQQTVLVTVQHVRQTADVKTMSRRLVCTPGINLATI